MKHKKTKTKTKPKTQVKKPKPLRMRRAPKKSQPKIIKRTITDSKIIIDPEHLKRLREIAADVKEHPDLRIRDKKAHFKKVPYLKSWLSFCNLHMKLNLFVHYSYDLFWNFSFFQRLYILICVTEFRHRWFIWVQFRQQIEKCLSVNKSIYQHYNIYIFNGIVLANIKRFAHSDRLRDNDSLDHTNRDGFHNKQKINCDWLKS